MFKRLATVTNPRMPIGGIYLGAGVGWLALRRRYACRMRRRRQHRTATENKTEAKRKRKDGRRRIGGERTRWEARE
eukprot:1181917-Prorocentrum_minimum.AAC.1